MDISAYLPYLTFGLIPWQFISGVVSEGCQTFILAQPVMHQAKMPSSVHVFRTIYRNLLVLAHNLIIIIAVIILFKVPVGWVTWMVVPGFAVLVFDAVWLVFILGMVSARFRDVPPIVTNMMQIIFFITPIFWAPESLGDFRIIADFNPFFALIDILRAPLLGQWPSETAWLMTAIYSLAEFVVGFMLFVRFRARIPYWV